jgi:hypothetical protein
MDDIKGGEDLNKIDAKSKQKLYEYIIGQPFGSQDNDGYEKFLDNIKNTVDKMGVSKFKEFEKLSPQLYEVYNYMYQNNEHEKTVAVSNRLANDETQTKEVRTRATALLMAAKFEIEGIDSSLPLTMRAEKLVKGNYKFKLDKAGKPIYTQEETLALDHDGLAKAKYMETFREALAYKAKAWLEYNLGESTGNKNHYGKAHDAKVKWQQSIKQLLGEQAMSELWAIKADISDERNPPKAKATNLPSKWINYSEKKLSDYMTMKATRAKSVENYMNSLSKDDKTLYNNTGDKRLTADQVLNQVKFDSLNLY